MSDFGKIDQVSLETWVTQKTGANRTDVIQGPAFGVDTALVDLGGGKALAIASDPLSLIPSLGMKASAWLSVHLMANDIATTGFFPQYAQFVLNFPRNGKNDQLKKYWDYIHLFCEEIGVAITGGHTGIDPFGESTLAGGGTMFAQVDRNLAKSSRNAKPEQHLILTKTPALSSAAILARSFPDFTRAHLGDRLYEELYESFYETSVLPEIRSFSYDPECMQDISAMHDVTEGGVLGAIYELCEASGIGIEIDMSSLSVGEAQDKICALFQLDPLRCIGAGSLLVACDSKRSDVLLQLLSDQGLSAQKIGTFKSLDFGRKLNYTETHIEELIYHAKDPYWATFAEAIKRKLT